MLQINVLTDPLTESNCYILEEDGRCVIIDPGESDNLLQLLSTKQWTPDLVLLTHEHCDHMAGLDSLRSSYPLIRFPATAKCNEGIQNTKLNMSRIMGIYLHFRGKPGISYQRFVCRPADEIIADDEVIEWKGHSLRFIALPGHTPGSEGIMLDEKSFFCGDYLIKGEEVILRFPGGDEKQYKLITEPFLESLPAGIYICPGHKEAYELAR